MVMSVGQGLTFALRSFFIMFDELSL